MSILLNKDTNVIIQGITGRDGGFHTKMMIEYGTKVIAGVTPGKGGIEVAGKPVFNSVSDLKKEFSVDATTIFVPPKFAADAIWEAIDEEIKLIVVITEGIPALEMLKIKNYIKGKNITIIGPNCPGLISPGEAKMGILPGNICKKGNIGVISRSGTLTYEVVYGLTTAGIGQTTVVGIGGDPIIGSRFLKLLKMFNADEETEGIVLIGEIGGNDEIIAADYIKENVKKPVIAFIAGKTAPKGKRMGHAGAIISGKNETAQAKIEYLEKAGIKVANLPQDIPGFF
jgi:succinyl-CoA synthetase alpha subunit